MTAVYVSHILTSEDLYLFWSLTIELISMAQLTIFPISP